MKPEKRLCSCGENYLSETAAICRACYYKKKAEQKILNATPVFFCSCGQKKNQYSRKCRACWVKDGNPKYSVCACGKKKSFTAIRCQKCNTNIVKRKKPQNHCACGAVIKHQNKQCLPCYKKSKKAFLPHPNKLKFNKRRVI